MIKSRSNKSIKPDGLGGIKNGDPFARNRNEYLLADLIIVTPSVLY